MNINQFFMELDKLFAAKNPGKAETFMRDSLARAEAEQDPGAVITIANELGGYYRYVSRYNEGIALYDKALQLLTRLGQIKTPAHGTTLINYATTCTMMGDHAKALELYRQAADIFSAPQYAGDFNLATLYNNMSFVCQSMGDTKEAEDYLQKALSILEGLQDSQIEIAITYTNLANLYATEDQLDRAEEFLKRAANLYLAESGEQDVHYAATVSGLGELYYRRGDYRAAAEAFEKALALNIRDYGENTDSSRILEKNLQMCQEKLEEGVK